MAIAASCLYLYNCITANCYSISHVYEADMIIASKTASPEGAGSSATSADDSHLSPEAASSLATPADGSVL